VEKTVNENRGKVAVGDLSRIEAAIAEARKAVQGDDLASIKRAIDDLQRASHAMAEALYKGSNESSESRSSSGSSDVRDGEVVDAEYADSTK
jgi:molecular chaperone DnaK